MILISTVGLALMALPSSNMLTITGISDDTPDGAISLAVTAGDLDGDGVGDSGTLLLRCLDGKVAQALFHGAKAAREAGSGLATGRRTHVVPHVLEKSSRLAAMRPTYEVKSNKGARSGSSSPWSLTLSGADDLCPAAAAEVAKVKATKPRSNIQNN